MGITTQTLMKEKLILQKTFEMNTKINQLKKK